MAIFVSRSLDYAVRALICLAQAEQGRTLSLRELADDAVVPRSYLAKLMRTLVRSQLVHSDAGAHGGYRLSRPATQIYLSDIYESVEGPFHTVVCADAPGGCELLDGCTQVSVWSLLEHQIRDLLTQRSLADFVPPDPEGWVGLDRLAPAQARHANAQGAD